MEQCICLSYTDIRIVGHACNWRLCLWDEEKRYDTTGVNLRKKAINENRRRGWSRKYRRDLLLSVQPVLDSRVFKRKRRKSEKKKRISKCFTWETHQSLSVFFLVSFLWLVCFYSFINNRTNLNGLIFHSSFCINMMGIIFLLSVWDSLSIWSLIINIYI